MRWNNPKAWVQRRLYLDLLRDPKPTEDDSDEGMLYGFQFRADESDGGGAGHHWFKVGLILDAHDDDKLQDLIEREQERLPDGTKELHKVLRRNLTTLHRVIWRDQVIWHHTERAQDYDRVLDIFIRANSGGATLSKSDLLLSTITARWKKVNARKEIYDFVDRINKDLTRSSNNFSKDFVMKASGDYPHLT